MGREKILWTIQTLFKNIKLTKEDKQAIRDLWPPGKVIFLGPGDYQREADNFDWQRLKVYLDAKGYFKSLSVL